MNESMAYSLLIFLVADLRLMSATGRIVTPYECMAVDSDYQPRVSAADMAALYMTMAANTTASQHNRGQQKELSPAQCMALVLIEMRRSFEQVNTYHQQQSNKNKNNNNNDDDEEDDMYQDNDENDTGTFTEFIRSVKRKRRHNTRSSQQSPQQPHTLRQPNGMHKLLKAYADMLGHDLLERVPYIEARQSMLHLVNNNTNNTNSNSGNNKKKNLALNSIPENEKEDDKGDDNCQDDRKYKGTVKEDDGKKEGVTNDEGNRNHNTKVAKLDNQSRATNRAQQQQDGTATNVRATSNLRQIITDRVMSNRDGILLNRDQRDVKHMEQVTDTLFNMAIRHDEVANEALCLGDEKLRPSLTSPTKKDATFLTGAQLLTILERATKTRDNSKLDFMSKFFRDGTISQIMVQSQARFVWVNDFYPLKDLTYAIGIDRAKKRVLVVFRGAITRQDWATVTHVHQIKVKNPITEDFVGKPAKVNLHAGFYRYLFRVRQDTGTTKFDEICNVAHKYGAEQIGQDEYTMSVIGHSLGGALTTVFTFFASVDPRFVSNGPIKAFSFGSPYVGGHDFADSWRHQEQKGRIMYARFYNHNDTVAYVPLNVSVTSRGAPYRHVGVGIKIPRVPRWFTQFRKWKPRVNYVGNDGCVRAYRRALGRNVLLNSPFPTQIPQMHCLDELQERMRDGMLREGDRGDYELLHKPIEEIYNFIVGVDLERIKADISP